MQVIDNWAIVTGEVAEVRSDGDHFKLVVLVSEAKDFEDFPNLFTWAKGQLVTVEIPKEFSPPEVGAEITWRLQIISAGNAVPHASSLDSYLH